ncbi:hypothetical protein MJL30_40165, partial [Salmonella enterica subsp. enterica serovar Anatum]|nr:hypothetical protein [Salmonella enterica subsp. enterica serovar Anatum]
GVSGAGRKAAISNSFCEVSLQPYGVFTHRHQPEIAAHLGAEVKEGTSLLTPGIIELTGVADVPDEEVFGPLLNVWRYAHFDEA